MKIKNSMRLAAWLAVFALLMLSAAAATLDEMYENGVVSDGNVRFGDERDGVVSDVSEPMPGEAHRIRNGFDSAMSDGGNDNATGSVTGDDFGLNDDNILMGRNGAESGSAASECCHRSAMRTARAAIRAWSGGSSLPSSSLSPSWSL